MQRRSRSDPEYIRVRLCKEHEKFNEHLTKRRLAPPILSRLRNYAEEQQRTNLLRSENLMRQVQRCNGSLRREDRVLKHSRRSLQTQHKATDKELKAAQASLADKEKELSRVRTDMEKADEHRRAAEKELSGVRDQIELTEDKLDTVDKISVYQILISSPLLLCGRFSR